MNTDIKITMALRETLSLLEKGNYNSEETVNKILQSEDIQLSEGEWDCYRKKLPEYIFEKAESETTIRNFLDTVNLIQSPVLETALKNETVSIEYVKLVIEKIKEEALKIACKQKSNDLLYFLLSEDRSLANYKLNDGSYILHYAFQHCCSEDIIQTLLSYGAVIEAEDNEDRNILHYAALNPFDELWEIFIQKPAFSKYLKRPDSSGLIPQELRNTSK